MFLFGSSAAKNAPHFVPDSEARNWIAEGMVDLLHHLGPAARMPHLLTDPARLGLGRAATPNDLDSLFEMLCVVQEVVGQREVELTLLELDGRSSPNLPENVVHLGDPQGKLFHAARAGDEYVVMFTPAAFRVRELLLAGISRVLGHIALDRAGLTALREDPDAAEVVEEWDADAELAAVLLGMGVWVANGAYLFENACCGGGCGIDLRSIKAGLSLPEASYALALDAMRKGLPRRAVLRHLEPTQKAAAKQCWQAAKTPPLAACT